MKRKDFSEKWLGEIGGWKALKEARGMHKSGAVVRSVLDETSGGQWLMKGLVAAGRKQLACGLRVRSQSDVENLCSCSVSRRDGALCEHSLAVALAAMHPADEVEEPASAESTKEAAPKTKTQPGLRADFEMHGDLKRMWSKGRIQLLAKLTPDAEIESDPAVEWLSAHGVKVAGGGGSFPVVVGRSDLVALWQSMVGTQGRIVRNESPISIGEMPARMQLSVGESDSGGVRLERNALGDGSILLPDEESGTIWLWQEKSGRLLPVSVPSGERLRRELWSLMVDGSTLEMPVEWFIGVSAAIEDAFLLESDDDFLRRFSISPARLQLHLEVEGSLNAVSAKLEFSYVGSDENPLSERVPAGSRDEIPMMRDPVDSLRFLTRDASAESRSVRRLLSAGFSEPDDKGWLQLRGEDSILAFYAGLLPQLENEANWEVVRGERFRHVTRDVQVVRPVVEVAGSGEDWLEFELNYEGPGGERLDPADLQRLLQMGKSGLKKADGKRLAADLSAIGDMQEVLRDIQPEQSAGHYRVDRAQAEFVGRSAIGWGGSDGGLVGFHDETPPEFGALEECLRDYQKQGAAFLFARCQGGAGALLADEMGLGKTLQTLATLQALAKRSKGGAALIVCPTSLLGNWKKEAEKWTGQMKTLVLHGPKRAGLFSGINDNDLVLTSYGSLVRDIDKHAGIDYLAVVLDEASMIRNPDTQAAKAVRRLATKGRIALTGTPVENSVRDIWSILQYAVPGYLGSREDFKERYELPIARNPEGSKLEQDRLRRRLQPFLLRRTKREVAPELPEKIEQVRVCELTAAQKEVYAGLLKKGREKVDDLLKAQGFAAARMSILSILLRLRQVCCDLRVLEGFGKAKDADSTKLDALGELLDEAEAGGHRVLVFSQFVGVLSLLKNWCEERGTEFAYIDGSTPAEARAGEVARFQGGNGPGVFLISLKAGGYGLTLTAADTVVHFDPWWNPAVEQQATDRAHRIGQEKTVNVYKLICADTVDEKILRLQEKKRRVIDAAINDEAPLMSGLNEEDIADVLS